MKKGFTLIELLAVIVVLAIIAIIAIPIITNVIDNAKKGALKDSAYGLIDAGELYLAKNMNKGIVDTMEFTCNNGKCLSGTEEINYKGKIDSGKIKLYSDGKISVCVENGINSAIKLATEKEVTVKKGNCNYTGESYEIDEVVSLTKYNELKNELNELKDKGDAEASNILVNKKAVVKGQELTGTMPNNGALSKTLNAGESYIVPLGYTSGGTVTANTLASQTSATATESQIASGYTAWVNGNKITGTGTDAIKSIISIAQSYYSSSDAKSVDLGEKRKIIYTSSNIVPESGTAAYKIWGSDDNSTWNYINQYNANTTLTTNNFYKVQFNYRYIKVQSLANSYIKSISIAY